MAFTAELLIGARSSTNLAVHDYPFLTVLDLYWELQDPLYTLY